MVRSPIALLVGLVAVTLAVVATGGTSRASNVELSGAEGHPRARFPLAVYLGPAGAATLDAAAMRALDDWNGVGQATLGLRTFVPVGTSEQAHVAVSFEREAGRLMGETRISADGGGVIALPVRIAIFPAAPRGQTTREVLLYQVVAHELGHALGLAHTREPRSLMCCVPGSVEFNEPAAREAYIEARRHPSVGSAAVQLGEHYARFWARRP